MCFLVDSSVVAPKLRPNIIYIYCCSHIEKLRGRKTIFYLCQDLVMWSVSLTHLHMLSLVMWSTSLTHLHMLSLFPLCWELNLNLARAWKMLCCWAAPQALSLLFFDLTIPLWKKEDWTLSPCTCSSANHPLIPIIANSLFESQSYTKLIVLLKVQGSWWALDLEKAKFCSLPPSKQPGSPAWCLWQRKKTLEWVMHLYQ